MASCYAVEPCLTSFPASRWSLHQATLAIVLGLSRDGQCKPWFRLTEPNDSATATHVQSLVQRQLFGDVFAWAM